PSQKMTFSKFVHLGRFAVQCLHGRKRTFGCLSGHKPLCPRYGRPTRVVKFVEQENHISLTPVVHPDAQATPMGRTELTTLKLPGVLLLIRFWSFEALVVLRPMRDVAVIEKLLLADYEGTLSSLCVGQDSGFHPVHVCTAVLDELKVLLEPLSGVTGHMDDAQVGIACLHVHL